MPRKLFPLRCMTRFATMGTHITGLSLFFTLFSDEATAQLITDYLQLDLATARQNMQLFCTSFDDELELLDKYPETKHILAQLKRYPNVHVSLGSARFPSASMPTCNLSQPPLNSQVVHSVNAWELSQHFSGEKVSVVAWNHPHLGVEDFRLHRFLMAHFFHSVSEVLHRKVGLKRMKRRDLQPYSRMKITSA